MKVEFYKYHGTGNDFVIIDNREGRIQLNQAQIASICHRRFGVGADGLMLLETAEGYDFKMVYYNSDGHDSSMCGNGGRCLVKFAQDVGQIKDEARFIAVDGPHEAKLVNDWVHLKMIETGAPQGKDQGQFLDTGSPHHVLRVDDVNSTPVFEEGRRLRNEVYGQEGANINFVEKLDRNKIYVRTYERGVENETYSCGTGVTAAAIIASDQNWVEGNNVAIQTLGGDLAVSFEPSSNGYKEVWLKGPAVRVFRGTFEI
jgi:diaminopimelate epimerase